jgi:hypothetical protein
MQIVRTGMDDAEEKLELLREKLIAEGDRVLTSQLSERSTKRSQRAEHLCLTSVPLML